MPPPSLLVTRNLYPLHGVTEAFLDSVTPGIRNPSRKTRLWFWLYELFLSEEWDVLVATCERAWAAYGYPCSEGTDALRAVKQDPRSPPVLLRFLEYIHRSAMVMPTPLTNAPRDIMMPHIRPDPPLIPTEWSVNQRRRLWIAVKEAQRQQRLERLYQLLGAHPRPVVEAYLGGLKLAEGRGIQHQACLGSWPPLDAGEFQTPTPSLAWPAEWAPAAGTRGARLFGLPKHLVVPRPMHPTGMDVLVGCAFWRRVLGGLGLSVCEERGWPVFDSGDEASEAFYKTYFPTDIPDEWSALEREKSHSA